MSDEKLEHKVRIALRAAQMKRKIVPALLIEIHQRIDELHEEYTGEKKDKKTDWPIFEKRHDYHSGDHIDYDGMNGYYMNDFYKRHHEIVSFLDGVGVPDIKAVELAKLYHDLKAKDEFEKKKYEKWEFSGNKTRFPDDEPEELEEQGNHFVHLPTGNIFHYKCGHHDNEISENDVRGYPLTFNDLKSTPWFHNQHPVFNTMNYKAKLFLICLEVGDLLEMEPQNLLPL